MQIMHTQKEFVDLKKILKYFKIKNLGEYHDLYVQSNTLLLLPDVFENFGNACFKLCELDPA